MEIKQEIPFYARVTEVRHIKNGTFQRITPDYGKIKSENLIQRNHGREFRATLDKFRYMQTKQQVQSLDVFVNNTNLTFLYKIDIEVSLKVSAKNKVASSGN